jgi:hypothetical protein
MTRQTVSEVLNADIDDYNLKDCITTLTKAFNSVPEECRNSARFHVDYGEEYGSVYAHQEISYQRPETDDEMAKRIKQREWREERAISNAKRLLGIKE